MEYVIFVATLIWLILTIAMVYISKGDFVVCSYAVIFFVEATIVTASVVSFGYFVEKKLFFSCCF
jgi:hypothetical protein